MATTIAMKAARVPLRIVGRTFETVARHADDVRADPKKYWKPSLF